MFNLYRVCLKLFRWSDSYPNQMFFLGVLWSSCGRPMQCRQSKACVVFRLHRFEKLMALLICLMGFSLKGEAQTDKSKKTSISCCANLLPIKPLGLPSQKLLKWIIIDNFVSCILKQVCYISLFHTLEKVGCCKTQNICNLYVVFKKMHVLLWNKMLFFSQMV